MSSIKLLSNLRGRRALITGASGNLGRVIAETLAELGADLILVDQNDLEFTKQSAYLMSNWGIEVKNYVCDLEEQKQRQNLMQWIKSSGMELNILINNAAFAGTSALEGWNVPFNEQSVETWRRAIEVNLTAVFDLCQGLAPLLTVAKGANIINIASIYGIYGPDWSLYEGTTMSNPAAYAASKGGLIQLTRWLASTVAPNIRVNVLSPGGIFRNQPLEFVRRYEAKTLLGRMATEDDIKGAIGFLSSDLSRYVTGQNLVVDGGWG